MKLSTKSLFLIFLLLFFSSKVYANKKIKLQLNWLHQFQFAGYYIAKEKGFYNEVGLNVQIDEIDFNTNTTNEVLNEETDFGVGRSSLLIDKSHEKDVVAIAAIYQSSPLMLLVTKDSNINDITDLWGKNIMITSDARDTASIIAMLNSKGIETYDLNIQKHSFNLNDLISGKTDAMASYVSNEPIRLKDKDIEYKIFHPKDYGFEFYSDILFTSKSFLEKNPKITKKFYNASMKGWEYAFDNIGETANIIYEKYNSQNKTLLQLVKEGEKLKELIQNGEKVELGSLSKRKLQKIIEIYKVMGLVVEDINLDEFVYSENRHNEIVLELKHDEIFYYTLIAFLILTIIIGSTFYISVKRKWIITQDKLEAEIKDKTQKLKELATHDKLTKLYNRYKLDWVLETESEKTNRYDIDFGILIIDIDHFKHVNDTYGHNTGDCVLVELANILKISSRKSDIIGRWGGEEFLIIVPYSKKESITSYANNLRKKVEEYAFKDIDKLTVSIGVTIYKKGESIDTFISRADDALYTSKETGRNKVTFL